MSVVAAILAELEARPAEDWPAQLAARFPGDPALVRQLLVWLSAQRGAAAGADRPVLDDGGRYELAAELGAGATAAVWRAYDRKLRRDVAIKIFDAEAAAVDEILAEARAACEITSDHVVRVLDVHDVRGALAPYIVMELVGEHAPRGGALTPGASAATCRPRDLWEAVRWVRDVARGVHDAHLRNVFHRDLKPHNVLITPISRRAKIADFGLAVSARQPGQSASGIRIAGTPSYMAPEQARGLATALDPRDAADRAALVGIDIWGLGAIAYDLIAGRAPWQSQDSIDAWELAAGGSCPALPERVPDRLRRIIARALAPATADRYPSAGELADELSAMLACKPTSFDRSPARRAALWARRNPQLTLTAAVAVLLAAMSLAAYASVWRLSDQRAQLAGEVDRAIADRTRLADQARVSRAEIDATDAELRALQRSLATARDEYRAIVQAKEDALRSANVATRALTVARGDRDVAEKTRALYEAFWTRARKDAEDAARERDQATSERDAARQAVDQAIKDRDDARAGRARAEHDRDAARDERDRNAAARREAEAEIAQLMGELSTAVSAEHTKHTDDHTEPEPTVGAAH